MGLNGGSFISNNPNFTNVTFEVTDGALTLNKRNVTLTSATDSKVYDGTPLTNHTVTAGGDGFVAGQGAAYTVVGSQTLVGSSPNNFRYTFNPGTKASNYNITPVIGTLTVTQPAGGDVVVKIAGKTGSKKYLGAPQAIAGYDVTEITVGGAPTTLLKASDIKLAPGAQAVATGTNVGTYNMGLTAASFVQSNPNFGNVTFQVTDGKLEITKRSVTLTSLNAKKPYDGTPLVKHQVAVTGDGFVAFQNATFTFTGTQTAVGSSPNAFSYALTPNADPANYDIQKVEGTLEVTQRERIKVIIKGETKVVTYDGQPHTVNSYVAVSNSPLFNVNTDITYSGTPSVTRTDAGVSSLGMNPSQFSSNNPNFGNVEFIVTDGSVTVNKRKVTLTSESAMKDYDGTPLTNHTVNVGGEGMAPGESFNFNVTGSQTQVGVSDNEFTYTGNPGTNPDNYIITPIKGKLVVRGAVVTVTITGNNATHTYDGTEKTVTGYTAVSDNPSFNVATDLGFSGNDTVRRTNAGQTNMNLRPNQFRSLNPNYTNVRFVVTDGYLKIDPLSGVTINVTGNNITVNYDGRPHTATGYNIVPNNPLVSATDIAYRGIPSVTRTNEGTSNMNLDPNKFVSTNPNFTNIIVNVTDGFVKIDKTNVNVTITGNTKTVEYDGRQHVVQGYTVTSDNPLYHANYITYSGSTTVTGTNAGNYPMGLVPGGFTNTNPNFNVTITVGGDGQLTINPANVTVRVTGTQKTVDYNGKEQSVSGFTAVSSNPGYDAAANVTLVGTARAARTFPGTSFMGLTNASFNAVTGSPNIASVTLNVEDGFITIKPASVTVTIRGAQRQFPYDGETHYAVGYEMFSDNDRYDLSTEVLFTGEAKAQRREIGTTPMRLKASQFTNLNQLYSVRFVIDDGFVEITPSEVTQTIFNVVGNLNLASKLADRDKPGSFENLVKNNWSYPYKNLGKLITPNKDASELKEGEKPVRTVTVANISTFFTAGVPTQDNVATKEMINVLKAGGIDMVTIPSASANLVSPEIYRESAELLKEAGISTNAYEEDASVYLGDDQFMGMFAVHSNEFTPEIAKHIAQMKEKGQAVVVAEVHWNEAAYRAEREGENLSEAALERHVQERKQAMARAIIDAGANAVFGYSTEDVRGHEVYNGGYIFYGLGAMVNGGAVEPGPNGSWDSAVVKLRITNKNGEVKVTGFNTIPMSLSSSKDKNDYTPIMYEEGSEGYWRIMKKINGTWGK